MTKDLIVTKSDVAGAILLADVMANNQAIRCVTVMHECPSCKCEVECEHDDEWSCVGAALGISEASVALWLRSCGAVGCAWDRRLDPDLDHGPMSVEEAALEFSDEYDGHYEDLEAAALLRDGWLPPGTRLTHNYLLHPCGPK